MAELSASPLELDKHGAGAQHTSHQATGGARRASGVLIEVLVYLWLPERPFPPRHHTAELPAPVPACRILEQLEVPHASCTVPQVDLRSLRMVTLTAASRTR